MSAKVRGRVVLRGLSPLMTNPPTDDVLKVMETGDKAYGEDEKELTPEERARRRVHLDADGNPCLTAAIVRETLKNAGVYVKIDKKRQVSTKDGNTLLFGFFGLAGMQFPIVDSANGKPASWVPDLKLVPQKSSGRGSGGGAIVVRPRFDSWRIAVEFWFDPKRVKEKIVRRLFEEACTTIGFGSGRTIGMGRAEIVEWNVEPHGEEEPEEEAAEAAS